MLKKKLLSRSRDPLQLSANNKAEFDPLQLTQVAPPVNKTDLDPLQIQNYWSKGKSKIEKSNLYVKDKINRPRPYQMGKLLGINIKVKPAESSLTAACPSGHALQGYLLGLFLIKEYKINVNSKLGDLILKIASDIGLRRVIGGVHYISDNVISYYLFKIIMNRDKELCNYEYLHKLKNKIINILNFRFEFK
jgi:hypothetical protein